MASPRVAGQTHCAFGANGPSEDHSSTVHGSAGPTPSDSIIISPSSSTRCAGGQEAAAQSKEGLPANKRHAAPLDRAGRRRPALQEARGRMSSARFSAPDTLKQGGRADEVRLGLSTRSPCCPAGVPPHSLSAAYAHRPHHHAPFFEEARQTRPRSVYECGLERASDVSRPSGQPPSFYREASGRRLAGDRRGGLQGLEGRPIQNQVAVLVKYPPFCATRCGRRTVPRRSSSRPSALARTPGASVMTSSWTPCGGAKRVRLPGFELEQSAYAFLGPPSMPCRPWAVPCDRFGSLAKWQSPGLRSHGGSRARSLLSFFLIRVMLAAFNDVEGAVRSTR